MARKPKNQTNDTETAESILPEAENNGNVSQFPADAQPPESDEPKADTNELSVPPRLNSDILPIVTMASTTIAKCSDNEVKNFCATTDFVCRQVTTQLAELWKDICKTAQKNSKEGTKPAKVSLGISVTIDHSNIMIHTTDVETGFSEKHKASGGIQEDLRQMKLPVLDAEQDEDTNEDEADE